MENSEITKLVENLFPDQEIMWIYFGGSIAYGTKEDKSDTDIIAVLNGLKGVIHADIGNLDIFAYGYDDFQRRNHQDKTIALYYRVNSDDIITANDYLIYLNPSFEALYQEFISEKFEEILPQFLDGFIEYFDLLVNSDKVLLKRLYHIIRIRGLLDNYKETGKYVQKLPASWLKKVKAFKSGWEADTEGKLLDQVKSYLEEIREIRKELAQ